MKIVANYDGDYQDGYNSALKIEDYSTDDNQVILFIGIQCGIDKNILAPYRNYKRKILLDLWSPCAFFTNPDHFSIIDGFDEIYSICPFTCEWTNKKLNRKLMKYCFYPVNTKLMEPKEEVKTYDVFYSGSITGREHLHMVDIISEFNYVFVTQSKTKKATHRFISNSDKFTLAARSKIGIVFNKLYLSSEHILSLQKYNGWETNQAFDQVDGVESKIAPEGLAFRKRAAIFVDKFVQNDFLRYNLLFPRHTKAAPIASQFKSRVHELALCKCLILCHKDPWSLIEDYYVPNKEFVYFDKIEDLKTMIPEIIKKYDSYKPVIEAAYQKAKTYNTSQFIDLVENNEEFKRA